MDSQNKKIAVFASRPVWKPIGLGAILFGVKFFLLAALWFAAVECLAAVPAPLNALQKAAQAGDAVAEDSLGQWYDDHGKPAQAVEWYRKAADQGNVSGLYHMGVMLEEGSGIDRDFRGSLVYYSKAAEGVFPAATFRIGRIFMEGICVKQDYSAARHWFLLSKNIWAFWYLAGMFEQGQGGPKNLPEAARLYKKVYRACREAGCAPSHFERHTPDQLAANNLGSMYLEGRGVRQDPYQAYLWFLRGLFGADAQDKRDLTAAEKMLTASQLHQAREEVAALPP